MGKPGMYPTIGDWVLAGLLFLFSIVCVLGFVAVVLYAPWLICGVGLGAGSIWLWRASWAEGGLSRVVGCMVSLGVMYWSANVLVGGVRGVF